MMQLCLSSDGLGEFKKGNGLFGSGPSVPLRATNISGWKDGNTWFEVQSTNGPRSLATLHRVSHWPS